MKFPKERGWRDVNECPVCHREWEEGDTLAYTMRDGYMVPTHMRCAMERETQEALDDRAELVAAAKRFKDRLESMQHDMPPEFAKVFNDEVWNLI